MKAIQISEINTPEVPVTIKHRKPRQFPPCTDNDFVMFEPGSELNGKLTLSGEYVGRATLPTMGIFSKDLRLIGVDPSFTYYRVDAVSQTRQTVSRIKCEFITFDEANIRMRELQFARVRRIVDAEQKAVRKERGKAKLKGSSLPAA